MGIFVSVSHWKHLEQKRLSPISLCSPRLLEVNRVVCAQRLGPDGPPHPILQDLMHSWDGITYAYGVLQFSANYVSAMNIRRAFHRTSKIYGPFCQTHRYEYFASGVFLDVEQAGIPKVFT